MGESFLHQVTRTALNLSKKKESIPDFQVHLEGISETLRVVIYLIFNLLRSEPNKIKKKD